METLENLLAQVAATAHDNPAKDIDRAADDLVRAVKVALDGQRLRGLPNLGTEAAPFFGANLTDNLAPITVKIPFPSKGRDEGAKQVVFTDDGAAVVVYAVRRRALPMVVARTRTEWFDFERSPARLTGQQLKFLVDKLPYWLQAHLQILEHEKGSARDAVTKAKEIVRVMEKVAKEKR